MEYRQYAVLFTLCLAQVSADMRLASHPCDPNPVTNCTGKSWKTINKATVKFVNPISLYIEPSAFNFAGLATQRKHAYDNFLRSNIDNEHNRRHFVNEPGRDMLPFRSYEGGMTDTTTFSATNTIGVNAVLTNTPTVPAAGYTLL